MVYCHSSPKELCKNYTGILSSRNTWQSLKRISVSLTLIKLKTYIKRDQFSGLPRNQLAYCSWYCSQNHCLFLQKICSVHRTLCLLKRHRYTSNYFYWKRTFPWKSKEKKTVAIFAFRNIHKHHPKFPLSRFQEKELCF